MYLNTLKPANNSKHSAKRVGRGIGSGMGKTCCRGHKGQKARSGGYHKVGFEGGQMPLQRRLPKYGSLKPKIDDTKIILRMYQLAKLGVDKVDIDVLKQAKLINAKVKEVKVFASGKLEKPLTLVGIQTTPGVRAAIEAAGGKVE